MSIKSILAPITGYERDDTALVSGLGLARKLGAFVDALHVKPDPREAVPMVAEGAAGPVIARIMELAEKEADARALQAQRLFEGACAKAKVVFTGPQASARYGALVGRAADDVSVRARVHDLVLMGRVPEDSDIEWRLTLEATLMESGRPVLLLPADLAAWKGNTVAIAWNGSTEAARAASAAMPLLAQADRVLLLAGVKDEPVEPSLDSLAEWLGHHGIKGEQRRVALESWPVGERLVEEAAAAGADLVVMGGYGHSRMRETIFGGATRAVLNEAKLPVLLEH
jgi:nucleotide-binding universal stress UspA family protein